MYFLLTDAQIRKRIADRAERILQFGTGRAVKVIIGLCGAIAQQVRHVRAGTVKPDRIYNDVVVFHLRTHLGQPRIQRRHRPARGRATQTPFA